MDENNIEEDIEEGNLDFILCPKCYFKLDFDDWIKHGCPNCGEING